MKESSVPGSGGDADFRVAEQWPLAALVARLLALSPGSTGSGGDALFEEDAVAVRVQVGQDRPSVSVRRARGIASAAVKDVEPLRFGSRAAGRRGG